MTSEGGYNISPMRNYFTGKIVFLTGGTGFLGQLYVEKLLRSGVQRIYLLARSKKNKTPQQRIEESFVGNQFSLLRQDDKNYMQRLTIIEGDMQELSVGISESDRKVLVENVQIVLHAAADVRFDEKLHQLLLTNLRGTRELLKLAEEMKKLEVFSYISTAYSNCIRSRVLEKFYDCAIDPEVMIGLGEKCWNDPKQAEFLEILTQRIIDPWPNAYVYTKSLSEQVVRRSRNKFPICVIRPSIVISTHEDPIPGWCNNIYGLNGVLVAGGYGFLRLALIKSKNIGDVVCADYVINATLAAIWVTHMDAVSNKQKPKSISLASSETTSDPKIYHVCTSNDRPTTWGELCGDVHKMGLIYPSTKMMWKPSYNVTQCLFMYKYLSIFYHIIPALAFDTIFSMRGDKLRVLPMYRKTARFMNALTYFMMNEWIFDTTNMRKVINRMTTYDREFFPSDVKQWNWSHYQYNYLQGLKIYLAKEDLNDSEKAKHRLNLFSFLHIFVLATYYGLHSFVFISILDSMGVFGYIKGSVHNTYEFLMNPYEI